MISDHWHLDSPLFGDTRTPNSLMSSRGTVDQLPLFGSEPLLNPGHPPPPPPQPYGLTPSSMSPCPAQPSPDHRASQLVAGRRHEPVCGLSRLILIHHHRIHFHTGSSDWQHGSLTGPLHWVCVTALYRWSTCMAIISLDAEIQLFQWPRLCD